MWHETLRAVGPTSIWFWITFHAGVFIALALDLVQFKQRGRELSIRAAAQRTAIWIVLSLLFNLLVWQIRGPDKALEFLTGYVIEYSLSVDNIFVFIIIFAYFRVPPMAQHRALVWGIVGALVMRGLMIWLGVALVERFDFILYLFGAFLLVSAWRMFFVKQEAKDFGQSWVMRCCLRMFPTTPDFHGEHFKAKLNGRWMLTPRSDTVLSRWRNHSGRILGSRCVVPFWWPLAWQSKQAEPWLGSSDFLSSVALNCCCGNGVSNSRNPSSCRGVSRPLNISK